MFQLSSSRNMGHSTVDYNEVGARQKLTFGGGKMGRISLFLTELINSSEGV